MPMTDLSGLIKERKLKYLYCPKCGEQSAFPHGVEFIGSEEDKFAGYFDRYQCERCKYTFVDY